MKVVTINANKIPKLKKSAAAIGYFDGFHQGHMQLIEKTREIADEKKLVSALITFDPDPWEIFKPNENKDHIISLQDKITMCSSFGIEYLYVLEFNAEFANRTIESFHQVLEKMNVQALICGYDFTYGQYGAGNVKSLQAQDRFEVSVIDPVESLHEKISSTRIEKLIRAGLVLKAAELLGYYYSIPGIVVHGFKRGGDMLEMPTANLQPEAGYIQPACGVYSGYVYDGNGLHKAMINIGTNPTFNNARESIEAHIFNYHQMIYGKMVRFFFVERIRPEKRFANLEELKEQLHKDKKRSLNSLDEHSALFGSTVDLWNSAGNFDILSK